MDDEDEAMVAIEKQLSKGAAKARLYENTGPFVFFFLLFGYCEANWCCRPLFGFSIVDEFLLIDDPFKLVLDVEVVFSVEFGTADDDKEDGDELEVSEAVEGEAGGFAKEEGDESDEEFVDVDKRVAKRGTKGETDETSASY